MSNPNLGTVVLVPADIKENYSDEETEKESSCPGRSANMSENSYRVCIMYYVILFSLVDR